MSSSSAIPQISSEEIATQDYLRALAAFNAVLRADPICRQLMADKRAWGDIMYEDDQRNAVKDAPSVSLFDKMLAQQAALPVPVVQSSATTSAVRGSYLLENSRKFMFLPCIGASKICIASFACLV